MKVKIVQCSNHMFWYSDRVGEIFEAIKNDGSTILEKSDWKYLVSTNDGGSNYFGSGVKGCDCVIVQEDKSLEDAFDEPDSVPWTEATTHHQGECITYQQRERLTQERLYKYPETKPLVAKKSIEQLAIDVLFNTTGKTYTEREIVAIVTIVNTIKELEK